MAELGMAFLNPIATAQKMGEEEQAAPLARAHEAATTRYLGAQTDTLEYNLKGEKAAAALMAQRLGSSSIPGSGPQDGKPPDLSDSLAGMAQIYSQAGLPSKAMDAFKAATQAQSHEAVARAADLRAQNEKITTGIKIADKAASMLGDVKTPEAWQAFNDTVAKVTGRPSPWAGYPYDPRFVDSIRGMAMTASQKATLRLKELADADRAKNISSEIAHRAVQDDMAAKRLQIQRDRLAAMKKDGGKDLGSPSSSEVKAASNLITAIPGLVGAGDSDTLDLAAFDTAAVARGIRKKNPGVTEDEALRQAIQQKRDSGDFSFTVTPPKTLLGVKIPGTGGGKTLSYTVAQPLPRSGKAADLVVGQHYVSDGKTMEWTGKGWKPVGGKAAPTPPPPPPEDDDEGGADQ